MDIITLAFGSYGLDFARFVIAMGLGTASAVWITIPSLSILSMKNMDPRAQVPFPLVSWGLDAGGLIIAALTGFIGIELSALAFPGSNPFYVWVFQALGILSVAVFLATFLTWVTKDRPEDRDVHASFALAYATALALIFPLIVLCVPYRMAKWQEARTA